MCRSGADGQSTPRERSCTSVSVTSLTCQVPVRHTDRSLRSPPHQGNASAYNSASVTIDFLVSNPPYSSDLFFYSPIHFIHLTSFSPTDLFLQPSPPPPRDVPQTQKFTSLLQRAQFLDRTGSRGRGNGWWLGGGGHERRFSRDPLSVRLFCGRPSLLLQAT